MIVIATAFIAPTIVRWAVNRNKCFRHRLSAHAGEGSLVGQSNPPKSADVGSSSAPPKQ